MEKLKRSLGAMREGATLVTVIIATAFLVAVGAIILSASTKYLVSVYMDRNSNENLYDAEGVLEEVRAGLLEYAGESGEAAYKNILENYNQYEGNIRTEFGKQYICGIASRIDYSTSNYTWADNEDPAKTGVAIVRRVGLSKIRPLTKAKGKEGTNVVISKATLEALLAGEDVNDEEDDSKDGSSSSNTGDDNTGTNTNDGSNDNGTGTNTGDDNGAASLFGLGGAKVAYAAETNPETPSDPETSADPGALPETSADPGSTTEDSSTADETGGTKDVVYIINYSSTKGYYLTIKNLVIDFQSEANYRSTIETDIQFTVPDYKFEGDDTVSSSKDFLIISDGVLNVTSGAQRTNSLTEVGGASFDGNIYTGGDVVDKDSLSNAGIKIDNSAEAHFNCEKFISRGSFDVYTGAEVTVAGPKTTTTTTDADGNTSTTTDDSTNGDIYLKNIRILRNDPTGTADATGDTSGSGSTTAFDRTNFTIKANTYVENDLDIRDVGSTVTLGGKYFGYSYNKENTSSDLASQAEYSSAILVNGFNTTIETEGLTKLILSGRAFVQRSELPAGVTDSPDIIMGESSAVKSNQIAYLVPDKYMKLEHNPNTKKECTDQNIDYSDPSEMVDLEKFKESEIYQYLDQSDDGKKCVTANYIQADNADSEGYAFVFLNFKSQADANKYFKKFYSSGFDNKVATDPDEEDEVDESFTKDDLNDRARSYISSAEDGGIKLAPELFLIAGNIVHDYYATDGASFQSANYFDGTGFPSSALLADGFKNGIKYVNMQTTLSAKGNAVSMRLLDESNPWMSTSSTDESGITTTTANSKAPALVKNSLINFDNIPNIAQSEGRSEAQTGAKVYANDSGGKLVLDSTYLGLPEGAAVGTVGRCLVVNKGDVDIAADCAGLIIAGGDVNVTQNFTGLIIAGGKVTVSSSVNLKSDQVIIDKLLDYAQTDEDLAKIFTGLSNPVTHNTTDMDKSIKYLNWTKNTY